MQQVAPGIRCWQAPHPEWNDRQDWGPAVSSYAIECGDHVVLVDPTELPAELVATLPGRDVAIVLTCPWHRRAALAISARLGAPLWVPPPDAPDPDPVPGAVFRAGDVLPFGVEARAGMEPNDLVLWVPEHAALVLGDSLMDRGHGLEFPRNWDDKGFASEELLAGMHQLLDLPVEHVLPTHGAPRSRDALVRALA